MISIYDYNNLPFWSETDILARAQFADTFEQAMRLPMSDRNRAWRFERIEAPMLIPRELLNAEYTDEQIFAIPNKPAALRHECAQALANDPELMAILHAKLPQPFAIDPARCKESFELAALDDHAASLIDPRLDALVTLWAEHARRSTKALALRPETTPATYAWMLRSLRQKPSSLPYCCWQLNKSFRREQDQPSKHMRLKEFWQQEFQCAYTSDTMEDWQAFVVEPVKNAIAEITSCPTRVVVSDRLPAYSVLTIDIEVWNSEKWMEICSISKRIDFPDDSFLIQKSSAPAKSILVCEVATSPDRQHYCRERWRAAWDNFPREEHIDHDWRSRLVSNAQAAQMRADWAANNR